MESVGFHDGNITDLIDKRTLHVRQVCRPPRLQFQFIGYCENSSASLFLVFNYASNGTRLRFLFLFFFPPFFFLIKMNRELNFCWEISPFIVDQVYLKKQLETRILHQINRRGDSSCFTVLFFLKNNSGVRVSFRAARSWGQIPQPICGVPLKATADWPQRKQSFLLL